MRKLWRNFAIFWFLSFLPLAIIFFPAGNIRPDKFLFVAVTAGIVTSLILAFAYIGIVLLLKQKLSKADSLWLLPVYYIVIWVIAIVLVAFSADEKIEKQMIYADPQGFPSEL